MKAWKWGSIIIVCAVGIVAFAAKQGADDQRRLRTALAMTGGYAGMTEGQVNELITSVSNKGIGTVGQTREVAFWLICSGRVTYKDMEPLTQSALHLMSAEKISERAAVTTIIKMLDPSAGAALDRCPK
ncbi:phage tail length tape measure family protein [Undibacterium pigrum]|uniref:Tail length tape measure protein n=1 Tax=Undibacterium pigrum TaxID=401470 RepID=A0A318IS32_9BURK|nr:phage tail length tape measure family protein [Undibacterium pigrum]PXX37823.1 tail length tape measure protein [Undibacterium pigrum]